MVREEVELRLSEGLSQPRTALFSCRTFSKLARAISF